MEIKNFTQKVLKKFNKQITDEIFLFIQNDRELLHDYLLLLNNHTLDTLNVNIAKQIKDNYGFESGAICKDPKSKLIQSFTEFEK
tara:strand:- start:325 stop:579 length:255 start_codon:yes stop_codon:yes gene_type:complete